MGRTEKQKGGDNMARSSAVVNINISTGKKTPVLSPKAAQEFIERKRAIRERVNQRIKDNNETKK
ncbi:MAG: hypothetical protein ACYC4E_00360 [Carboxydocellales bacterium]